MSNPSSPPFFDKATKGILRIRWLSAGLPFEAFGSEAKNGGGFEEEVEEVSAFAENAAEDFGDGEDSENPFQTESQKPWILSISRRSFFVGRPPGFSNLAMCQFFWTSKTSGAVSSS